MFARMAETLFADRDPTEVFFKGKIQTLQRERGGYTLVLRVPFAGAKDISLTKVGNEMVISIANVRRDLFLPRALALLRIETAELEDGLLRIHFQKKESSTGMARRGRVATRG